jgi:hypothetical protein
MGWPRPALAAPAGELAVYDLTYLYDYDLGDPEQAARAFEHMHLVATLQGIVNRDALRLYVRFIRGGEGDPFNRDDYWLDKLRVPGEWLAGRRLEPVRDPLDVRRRAGLFLLPWAPARSPEYPATMRAERGAPHYP